MSSSTKASSASSRRSRISIDTWAVVLALGLAAVVRLGILPTIKW